MATEILMPALSPTMEEGKLVKWHVGEGDSVRAGDVIAEIETDKATMEVESVDDGHVGKILVPEGTEHVPVNQPIAVLLTNGEGAVVSAAGEAALKPNESVAAPALPATGRVRHGRGGRRISRRL
jgi:pyruvate/2-oxoglutarate dehydrogenase complex dihydrolipoamide acyltransferase (E2) component